MTPEQWLESITAMQVVVWVAFVAGVLVAVVKTIRAIRPKWQRVADFLEDWSGTPARPGVPARASMPERLARIEQDSARASFNTASNHGSSSHDQVMGRLDCQKDQLAALTETIEHIAERLGMTEQATEFLAEQLEKNHPPDPASEI